MANEDDATSTEDLSPVGEPDRPADASGEDAIPEDPTLGIPTILEWRDASRAGASRIERKG